MAKVDWHGLSFDDIDLRLCTLCGTCCSACPVNALAWQPAGVKPDKEPEKIVFARTKCARCGLCYAVCPAENSSGAPLRKPADSLMGPCLSLSRAFAADPLVREAGSAGGAVTALLISALEQDVIDAALVVRADPDDPTRPAVVLARSPSEIRGAAQSKYCIAPVNATLSSFQDSAERIAVVALPCQAHGLRLAQSLNLGISRQITLVIGLFCGFNLRYAGTRYLLHRLNLGPEDVVQLEYRGGPWPGGFRALTRDGREGSIPKHQYTYVHLMYAPEGCWFCPDLTAEHADISVGDYWTGGAQSYSLVVGRTAAGQALLESAEAARDITTEAITYEEALSSHHHLLEYKKKGVQVRRRLSGRKPVDGYELPSLTATDWLGSAAFYAMMRFTSGTVGRLMIELLPLQLAQLLSEEARRLFRR